MRLIEMALTTHRRIVLGAFICFCPGGCRDVGDGETGVGTNGSTGPPESAASICLGSSDMVLAARLSSGGQDDVALLSEIGFYYLYLDGTCRYWVLGEPGAAHSTEARTGVLGEEEELALSDALAAGRLSELSGWYGGIGEDVGIWFISDGTDTIACPGNCAETPPDLADPVVLELSNAAQEWISRLWSAGDPLMTSMRADVLRYPGELRDDPCRIHWPYDWSLLDYAEVPTAHIEGPGHGLPVTDPVHVSDFREIRTLARTEAPIGCALGNERPEMHFEHMGESYYVLVRDAVPFEEINGLISLPLPE